jgi:hypothetical protein
MLCLGTLGEDETELDTLRYHTVRCVRVAGRMKVDMSTERASNRASNCRQDAVTSVE